MLLHHCRLTDLPVLVLSAIGKIMVLFSDRDR